MYFHTVSMSVKNLLDDSSLELKLVVDADLNRPIRWVHVTELADPAPYLEGDELILTAGIWHARGGSADDFVAALQTKSVAGIGYGLLDSDEVVPRTLVIACRRAGVPLLVVPVTTPFVAITQRFVQRLADEREADLRRTLAFTGDLIAAADSVTPADSLRAVVRLVSQETGRSTWITDANGRQLAAVGSAPNNRVPEVQGGHRDITQGSRVIASLVFAGGPLAQKEQSRFEAAVPVIGLILARERAVLETERRLAGECVSLLLARQVHAAAVRLASYGLSPQSRAVALVAHVEEGESALASAEEWLEDQELIGIVALRGNDIYMLVEISHAMDSARIHALAEDLVINIGGVAGGVGSVAPDVSKLRKSMVQARQACELALRRSGGTVLSHQLLGSHSLLLALQDQDVLDAFRDTLLAAIEDYDTRHSSELLATLQAFLETGGKWKQTANSMNIHVNTLRHRLAKVEEVTGRSLDETGDRVDLWLALHSREARRPRGHK